MLKPKPLTDAQVTALPVTGHEYMHADPRTAGFYVRVTAGGSKLFYARARYNGRRLRVPLGEHPQTSVSKARDLALAALSDGRAGKNPLAEREARAQAGRVQDMTVAVLAEKWMQDYVRPKLKPRTIADYQQLLDRHILPALGGLYVPLVTRDDVVQLHVSMARTPRRANYVAATVRAIFNFSIDLRLRPPADNPARRVKMYREGKRERFLSELEIGKAAVAIAEAEVEGVIGPYAAAGLRLCLFTGARSGEIAAAKWEHVDWERRIIRLPDSKTNEPRTIHLSDAALLVLRSLPRREPFVIAGAKAGEPFKNLSRSWIVARRKRELTDVRLHDLRHSYASLAVGRGVSLEMVGKLLGHKVQATTQRYAHLARDAAAAVNDELGEVMQAAIDKKPPHDAKVVKLRSRGRK
jgi:integrase